MFAEFRGHQYFSPLSYGLGYWVIDGSSAIFDQSLFICTIETAYIVHTLLRKYITYPAKCNVIM